MYNLILNEDNMAGITCDKCEETAYIVGRCQCRIIPKYLRKVRGFHNIDNIKYLDKFGTSYAIRDIKGEIN